VGQDCILQAGFSTGLLVLTIPVRAAPMKSARSLQSCPTMAHADSPSTRESPVTSGGLRLDAPRLDIGTEAPGIETSLDAAA
jgi:hypothetical protein